MRYAAWSVASVFIAGLLAASVFGNRLATLPAHVLIRDKSNKEASPVEGMNILQGNLSKREHETAQRLAKARRAGAAARHAVSVAKWTVAVEAAQDREKAAQLIVATTEYAHDAEATAEFIAGFCDAQFEKHSSQ